MKKIILIVAMAAMFLGSTATWKIRGLNGDKRPILERKVVANYGGQSVNWNTLLAGTKFKLPITVIEGTAADSAKHIYKIQPIPYFDDTLHYIQIKGNVIIKLD